MGADALADAARERLRHRLGRDHRRRPRDAGAGVLPRAVRLRAGGDARRQSRSARSIARGSTRCSTRRGGHDRPRIFVPRDAGALALGADEVRARDHRRRAAARHRRSRSCAPARAASIWLEPMIEVATPQGRIAYGPVHAGDVEPLVRCRLARRRRRIRCASAGRRRSRSSSARRASPSRAAASSTGSRSTITARMAGFAGWSARSRSGPAAIVEEVVKSGLARPRRRRVSRPASNGAPTAQADGGAEIHRLQRRRGRYRHLRRPHDHGRRSRSS